MRKSYGFLATLLVTISQAALAQTDITTPYVTSTDGSLTSGGWKFLNDGTTTHGSLTVDSLGGVNYSTLSFFGSSTATLSADYAINNSNVAFNDSSSLSVTGGQYGLTYTNATFAGNSSFFASAFYSSVGGSLTFTDTASAEAAVEYAVVTQTATFKNNSTLTASGGKGWAAATTILEDNSSAVSEVAGGIYSGTFKAYDDSTITVNAASGIQYTEFELHDQVRMNLNAESSLENSNIKLSGDARVELAADNAFGASVNVSFDNSTGGTGGVLALNGHDAAIGVILNSTSGAGVIRNGGANDVEFSINASSSDFSGLIEDGGTGSLSLTKSFVQTLTLSGANTYTGVTKVTGGILVLKNDHALGSSSAGTIVNGGTIALSGDLNVAESFDFQTGNFQNGDIQNLDGNSVISGQVAMSSNLDVLVKQGSLTITGDVTGTGGVGILGSGAGDLILSGHVDLGTGALYAQGTGSIVLNGEETNILSRITAEHGSIVLDFGNMTTPENLVSPTAQAYLTGGRLKVLGKGGPDLSSQTFSILALNSGQNWIELDARGGGGTSLSIGSAISASNGATLNVALPSGTSLLSTIDAKTLGNVTVTDDTGTGLGRATGTQIVRLTGQTALAPNSSDGTVDFLTAPTGSSDTSTPYLVMDGDFNVSSLTIDTSLATGANVLDLAGHTMNVASSGLLMQGGNDYTILGGQVGGMDKDLYIHTLGNGRLAITGSLSGGNRSLIKAGDGVLVLSGQSTYTGKTAINGGELIALSDGALGNTNEILVGTGATLTLGGGVDIGGSVSIKDGLLRKLAGDTSSIGTITGRGDVKVISEGGLFILNGTNQTYPYNANFAFDGDGDFLISGPYSAGEKFTKDGAGTMILETNLSTSGFVLNDGVLQIGNGGTTGQLNTWLVNNSHLVFNRSDTLDLYYGYSGTGTVEVKSGIVRWFADQNHTGRTTVSGGTLSLNSNFTALSGDIYVESAGTLEGKSRVGGEIFVSGTVSPGVDGNLGGSIGTLSSNAMTWEEGGTYHWEINDATGAVGWDRLQVENMLSIASSSADKFTISLNSIDAMGAAGVAANFRPNVDYAWNIASAGNISGFDVSKFVLDSSGFYSPVAGGEFSISQNGQNIVLSYLGVALDMVDEYQVSADGALQGKWNVLNDGDTTHGRVIADAAESFSANALMKFYGSSDVEITAYDAVKQGRLEFHDQSEARITAGYGISGGTLVFLDDAVARAEVASAIGGGNLSFSDNSSLIVTATGAIGTGATLSFEGNSHLDLEAESALMGNTLTFKDNAVLNANVAGAAYGSNLDFYDSAKLKASAGSMIQGTQTFHDSSVLEALGASAISGGNQNFHDSSRMIASAEDAVSGGIQAFYEDSVLEASATGAVSGGGQAFYDRSSLEISAADAVKTHVGFYNQSSLKVSGNGSLVSGSFDFTDDARLEASTSGAIAGGTQYFYANSVLSADAEDAVSGGSQTFNDQSELEILTAGAVSGGVQTFQGSKNFDVDIANGVTGGEQRIHGVTLNANVTNALSGNTIGVYSWGTLNVNAENALNGSNVVLSMGELALNGHSVTLGSLSDGSGGAGYITNNSASAAVLTVSPAAGSYDFGGRISESNGAISLVKTGAGKQILSYSNSYSGGTTISEGTLSVRADGATGSGSVVVESLATLEGNANLYGEVSVSGTISPGIGGSGVSIGALGAGAMTWNEGGTYHWEVNNVASGGWDQIYVGNTLDIAATSSSAFTISINSFDSIGDPGAPENFNPYLDYSWNIASATEITGFDADKFVLDTSGFHSPISGWDFSISQTGQDIVLTYIGVMRDIDGLYQTSADGQLNGRWNVLNDGVTTDGRVLADTADSFASGATVRFKGESYAEFSAENALQHGNLEFHDQSEARISVSNAISGGRQLFFDEAVAKADAEYAIVGGDLEFNDSSKLIASQTQAVAGGSLIFRGDASLVATAANAISANIGFYGNSHLDLEASGALEIGSVYFYDNAVLNARAESALGSNSFLSFNNNSKLKASAGSVTSGYTNFYNSSSLEATEALAVTGGYHTFYHDSRLKAMAEDSVKGGNQTFIGNSSLEASATRAVTGGSQYFNEDSTLLVSAKDAVAANIYFYDRSTLEFSGEGSIASGYYNFNGDSKLKASGAGAVEGGQQDFNGDSMLEASVAGAISGGTQNFYGNSSLDAQADGAVSGGVQNFNDVTLQINVAGAISGGQQTFSSGGTLDITVAGGVRGGVQTFFGNTSFDVNVAGAVVGGEQILYGNSLNANVENAMRGGLIRTYSGATINVNANNAINGSNIALDSGTLALNGHNAVVGGVSGYGSIKNESSSGVVLTLAPVSGSWNYDGSIVESDGVISVVKSGAGTQVLKGGSSYSGGTTITGGALFANGDGALGTGLVSVEAGGTLGGYGTLTNTVVLSGNISPGGGVGHTGTFTTGSETWNGGGSYLWDIITYNSCDFLQINGTLTLTNTVDDRFTIKVDSHGVVPFDPYNNYSWDIATASDGISGFDELAFRIDTSDFVSPGGSFKLVMDGNSLRLEFTRATHQVIDTLVVNQDNAIYGQVWEVLNDGTTTHGNIVVNEFYSVYGGDINFRGQSQLEAAAGEAIYGGTQIFNDQSRLLISAQNAIGSGEQTFNDNAILEIVSGGSLGSSTQTFNDNSKLNVVNGTLNGGTQNFYDDSVLAIGENGSWTGGIQTFHDRSSLVLSSENALENSNSYFHDESSFVLDAGNFDNGSAFFEFYDNATMKFTSRGAVTGGTLMFYGSSSLVANKAEAITGGTQYILENSRLIASSQDAIIGGEQIFRSNSFLKANGSKAINGGTQSFSNDSYLEASAAHAVYGGTQIFHDQSKLKATAADSIDGGYQSFRDSSSLEASASAILSGTQNFSDSSTLSANGANSVKGGTQQFTGNSTLFATVSNAITGGEQQFSDNATLEADATNSVNGGLQLIGDNAVLNANVTGSVGAANVVLFGSGTVSVNAENALTSSTSILFNGIGGAGGVLALNGHSTTVGKIESEAGGGRITNSDSAATLTVDVSDYDNVYDGLIEDGSAILAIVKAGVGSLELTGANNFSGGTTVNAGTLVVCNTDGSATGSGNVLVGANGTLAGTGIIGGSVSVQGKLSPGNSPGLLTIEGDLTLMSGSTTTLEIFGDEFDQIFVGGSLEYGGALVLVLNVPINWSVDLFSFASLAGTNFSTVSVTGFGQTIALTRNDQVWSGSYGETVFTFDESNGEFLAVPEPATNLLLALGVGSLLLLLRRRKK